MDGYHDIVSAELALEGLGLLHGPLAELLEQRRVLWVEARGTLLRDTVRECVLMPLGGRVWPLTLALLQGTGATPLQDYSSSLTALMNIIEPEFKNRIFSVRRVQRDLKRR